MSMHRALTTLGCALTAVLATAWSAAPPAQPYRPATAATTGRTTEPAQATAAATVRTTLPVRAATAATTVRTHDGLVRAPPRRLSHLRGHPLRGAPVGRLRWAPPLPRPLVRGTGCDPARERLPAAGRRGARREHG
ncbi:hypothetical protein O1M54_00960 [Streptomyces diastatochromogenes]|nr:hypothetical protein [Streptomyces diastatochromogenes]